MKHQVLLPGVTLPRPPREGAPPVAPAGEYSADEHSAQGPDQWPALHDMMGSLFVFESHRPTPAPITVLGLPLKDAAPLTPEQQQEVDAAQLLAADPTLLHRCVPGWEDGGEAHGGREYLPLPPLAAPWAEALEHLAAQQAAGRRVLVLTLGDPLFFDIGTALSRRFPAESLHILPAPGLLQEICARAAVPWHMVRSVSLRGREDWRPFNVAVNSGLPVCVLTDAASAPYLLARHLLDRGVEDFSVQVFERVGHAQERMRRLSLRETASHEDFDGTCAVLLLPQTAQGKASTPPRPVLGLPDEELAAELGPMAAGPVRAAALSLLRISPRHTLWDVGSGSGAMALEACAMAHAGCVVAVERSPVRALGIRENRRRFGAAILEVHTGNAPECFDRLPPPDRIFLGGGCSGDGAEDMLEAACHYLAPGGRMAAGYVRMGALHAALEFFRRKGWPVELLSVHAAQGTPQADDVSLTPLNPVVLVAAQKPEGNA